LGTEIDVFGAFVKFMSPSILESIYKKETNNVGKDECIAFAGAYFVAVNPIVKQDATKNATKVKTNRISADLTQVLSLVPGKHTTQDRYRALISHHANHSHDSISHSLNFVHNNLLAAFQILGDNVNTSVILLRRGDNRRADLREEYLSRDFGAYGGANHSADHLTGHGSVVGNSLQRLRFEERGVGGEIFESSTDDGSKWR